MTDWTDKSVFSLIRLYETNAVYDKSHTEYRNRIVK